MRVFKPLIKLPLLSAANRIHKLNLIFKEAMTANNSTNSINTRLFKSKSIGIKLTTKVPLVNPSSTQLTCRFVIIKKRFPHKFNDHIRTAMI